LTGVDVVLSVGGLAVRISGKDSKTVRELGDGIGGVVGSQEVVESNVGKDRSERGRTVDPVEFCR
jgi:hypothetical protein